MKSQARPFLIAVFAVLAARANLPAAAPDLVGSSPSQPHEEQLSFEFADPELSIELVASEPQVISPVAIGWDAYGRLFVAEMRDYPNATNGGTIRLLEDRDGDGRYETARMFADGLRFPNSVLPWNGGVLVTAAPDLLFLRDTDGDGRADERRVILTGFGTGNQQLRANGLTWGMDGWIYGANGRSDGNVRRPDATNGVSLRGRDFRFHPETGEFESLAGRSQFGLALDEWGNRFLSWNTIPIRHEVFPDRYLANSASVAGESVIVDLLPRDDGGRVFSKTPAPLVFNNESSSHFNALAGLTIYRGPALGDVYRDNVFVGETLRNLVHRRVLTPVGTTFVATRPETGTEFLRSSDPWFHPVNFATGPDGAFYIVDFYRQFVEHPDFVPREMRDKVSWRTGSEHGRLWRVTRKGGRLAPENPASTLGALPLAGLVECFDSANGWRRETAQRLLVEKRDANSLEVLREFVRRARTPVGRALALQTLALIAPEGPDEASLLVALRDSSPNVRANAARLATVAWSSGGITNRALAKSLVDLADDPEPPVRLATVLALGAVADANLRETTLRFRFDQETDQWVRLAIAGSSRSLARDKVATVVSRPEKSAKPAPMPTAADPDRQKVIERFTPSLQMTGDRARGAATFAKLCLSCHYLQGRGTRVGPDLSGISARPAEALLTDLLDPSRQIAPEYAAYEATLVDGETISGLFASETETRITIRRAGASDENIPRARVRSMRATGKSLMPDGLEQGLSVQDVADLLAFMRNADGALLPR